MHKLDVQTWNPSDLKGAVTNLRQALSDRNITMGLNQTRDLLAKAMGAQNWKSLESAIGKSNSTNTSETRDNLSPETVWILTHTSYGDFGEPFINEWVGDSKTAVKKKFFHAVLEDHIAWEALAENVSDSMGIHGVSDYLSLNTTAYDAEEIILGALSFKGSEESAQIIRQEQETIRPFVRNLIKDERMRGNDLWDWEFITDKLADKISYRYWIELYTHGLGFDDEIDIRETTIASTKDRTQQERIYTLTRVIRDIGGQADTFAEKTPDMLDMAVFNSIVSEWAREAFFEFIEINTNTPEILLEQYPTGGMTQESQSRLLEAIEGCLPVDFNPEEEDDFAIKDRIYESIPVRAMIEAYEYMWEDEETFIWDQKTL